MINYITIVTDIYYKWTLEKPEATIKNGQSRDIGNIGYIKTQTEDKQNQKHNNDRHDNVVPFLGELRSITGTNHKKITSPI